MSGGGSVFVRVRRRGVEHHAVELSNVGGEAVHHAADLIHQRILAWRWTVVHGHQTPIAPSRNGAAARRPAAAAAAATADAARVLRNAGHLGLLPQTGSYPLADCTDRRWRLRPIGD